MKLEVDNNVESVGGGFDVIPASKNIWLITDVVKKDGVSGPESKNPGTPYLFYDFTLTLDESIDGKAEEFIGKTARYTAGLSTDKSQSFFLRTLNCWGVMDKLVKKLGADEADPASDQFAGALKLACLDVRVQATHDVTERNGFKNCDNFKFTKIAKPGAVQTPSNFD